MLGRDSLIRIEFLSIGPSIYTTNNKHVLERDILIIGIYVKNETFPISPVPFFSATGKS